MVLQSRHAWSLGLPIHHAIDTVCKLRPIHLGRLNIVKPGVLLIPLLHWGFQQLTRLWCRNILIRQRTLELIEILQYAGIIVAVGCLGGTHSVAISVVSVRSLRSVQRRRVVNGIRLHTVSTL